MAATPEDKERLRRGSPRNVGIVVAVIVIALVLVAVAVLAGLFKPAPLQRVNPPGSGAAVPYPLITKRWSGYGKETGGPGEGELPRGGGRGRNPAGNPQNGQFSRS